MKTAVALYRLARPYNALTGALAVFLGGYVAATGEWLAVTTAAFVTLLVTASSNAYNDYLDVEIDKVNRPDRVLPSGLVSRRAALAFSLTLAAISIVLAATINLPSFLITLFANVLLFVYSWRLKSTVLLGNAVVALVSAASVVFGGVAAGHARPSLLLALCVVTVILGREILKTMADYEGDLSQQVRTISTVWGREKARVVFSIIMAATPVVLLLPAMLERYRPIYVIMLVVGVFPVLTYVIFQVRPTTPAHKLERLSQLLKFDFIVWFVAVMLGYSA